MKYGFIRKFFRLLYHTLVQELRFHSLMFVVPFLERSAERALNLGKPVHFGICLDRFDRPCYHRRVVSI